MESFGHEIFWPIKSFLDPFSFDVISLMHIKWYKYPNPTNGQAYFNTLYIQQYNSDHHHQEAQDPSSVIIHTYRSMRAMIQS
jgi:hypothetical protein